MSVHLPDQLKRHSVNLRIAEVNKDPPSPTNPSVKSKGAAGCHSLHHRQECRSNNNVATPASQSIDHRAESPYFMGQKLCSDPSDRRNTGSEKSDVEDDGDQEDNAGPIDSFGFKNEIFADWDPMEGNCSYCERKGHAHDGDEEDYSATESVQREEASEAEEKIGASDYERHGDWFVESDKGEESRRVVHECVEATKL